MSDVPHDLASEEAVIEALILWPPCRDEVLELLDAEDFHSPANGHVFRVIADLVAEGEPVDYLTVHDMLKRRGVHIELGDLLSMSSPRLANGVAHAQIVDRMARRRRLMLLAQEAFDLAQGDDIDGAIARFEKAANG